MNQIKSITQFHRLLSLPDPLHPLISVLQISDMQEIKESDLWRKFSTDFYTVSLKKNVQVKVKYGQQYYDFDKGIMNFIAPKQIQSIEEAELTSLQEDCGTGHILMFHPDFLYKHPLSTAINQYGFFAYAVSEALHLSEREEKNTVEIFQKIQEEYQHIDKHTQEIILAQIDLLLHYCERFYERQFITRKVVNNDLIFRIEHLLDSYLDKNESLHNGIPTVEFLAEKLHLSPRYLSDMLRSLSGINAQQHIQLKLIEKGKNLLATTNLSVSEIAYQLGFEYPQSFHKMFKKRTEMSPLKYRASFN